MEYIANKEIIYARLVEVENKLEDFESSLPDATNDFIFAEYANAKLFELRSLKRILLAALNY